MSGKRRVKKSSARGKPKGGSSGVRDLVRSIKQHKNFRQLASYSVQCLSKAITPPTVGWEENMREAFENGAMEAITEVLQKHSGDESVLAASTQCLSAMATDSRYAAKLVESGALQSMLDSLANNPDQKEGMNETLQLLEAVANSNPEALLANGGAESVLKLLESAKASGKGDMVAVCMRSLEKINKVPGGSEKLAELGAIDSLMDSIQTVYATPEEAEAILLPCMNMLERMCRQPAIAEQIQGQDGMMKICAALDRYPALEKVAKSGGRVLTKLAAGNVEDLIKRMETASPEEKAFLSQLLANLALEDENVEQIVEAGGISSLITLLSSSGGKALSASVRAITRIASQHENVDKLLQGGVVESLISALAANPGDEEIMSAVAPCLVQLMHSPEGLRRIVEAGGIDAVLSSLMDKLDSESNVEQMMKLFEHLGTTDYDIEQLVSKGAVKSVIDGMYAFPKNKDIQLNGSRSLVYMTTTEANARAVADAKGLDVLLGNLGAKSKNKDVVLTCMYELSTLSLVPEVKAKVQEQEGMDVVLEAIAAFPKDNEVKASAREVVEVVSDAGMVDSCISTITAKLESFRDGKSMKDAKALVRLAGRAGAFSIVPEHAGAMVKKDGVRALVASLEAVAAMAQAPKQEQILTACFNALVDISQSVSHDEELRQMLGQSGAVKAVITAIKSRPKLRDQVKAGVEFLESYAQVPEFATIIAKEGGIEAVVTAMKANQTDVDVTGTCIDTLLKLCATDEGALDVAKHGGVRQLISTIESNLNTPNFKPVMEKIMAVFQRVASTPEGASVLAKQGALDAVISAGDLLGAGSQSTTRVLAKLLTPTDVTSAFETLMEVGGKASAGHLPPFEAVRPLISKVSQMALVSGFAGRFADTAAVSSIVHILQQAINSTDEELRAEMVPTTLRALANIAKTNDIDLVGMGVTQMIKQAFDIDAGVAEALDLVTSAASRSETSAYGIATDGFTVDAIIAKLKANLRNPEIAAACFQALAALSKHPSTAAIIANTEAKTLAMSWLDDNMDDADPKHVAEALSLLSNLCQDPATAAQVVEEGGLDLVKSVLSRCCMDSNVANPEILRSVVSVVKSLANDPANVSRMVSSNVLKRVLKAISSNPAYIKDPECMESVLNMVSALGAYPEAAEELVALGAEDMIVSAMNHNGNKQETLIAGAKAMAALGAGADAGYHALEDVKQLMEIVSKETPPSPENIEALGQALQRLVNLTVVDGIVTAENADQMMYTLASALSLLTETGLASEGVLANGIQGLGRIIATGLVSDVADATDLVMAISSMYPDSQELQRAAVNCIGNLVKDPASVSVLAQRGCIDMLQDLLRRYPGDVEFESLINEAVAKISDQVYSGAGQLIGMEGGADAIADVINATAYDPHMLITCVESIAAMEGGDDALWAALCSAKTSGSSAGEIVRALVSKYESLGADVSIVASPKRAAAVMNALKAALQAQTIAINAGDEIARLEASKHANNVLGLLSAMATQLTPETAAAISSTVGIEPLLSLLQSNMEDRDSVAKVIKVLNAMIAAGDRTAAEYLSKPENMGKIVAAMKLFQNDEEIMADAAELLSGCTHLMGAQGSGVDREAMRTINAVREHFSHNPRFATATAALDAALGEVFSDEPLRLMQEALAGAADVASKGGRIQVHRTEDGRLYYYNPDTGETVWDPPEEYLAMKAQLAAMASTALKQQEDNVMDADESTLAALVSMLENGAADPDVAQAAAQTLQMLGMNMFNVDAIARNGGIRAIIAAIRLNPDNIALLKLLLILLERISRNDYFKEMIAQEGGIQVVIDIGIFRHTEVEEVCVKCLSTLANLAYNSPANITRIVEQQGVKAVEKAMQEYPNAPRLLENAMCCLSNLMFGSDENKLLIGQTTGDEITHIIRVHYQDVNLFKMALRALGNLSYCDENIRFIVEEGATTCIVTGMQTHNSDDEALQLSMEVIGNFASIEEDVDEGQETVPSIIFTQGGTENIIRIMREQETNLAILKSGMDALSNVANDQEITQRMAAEQGVVQLIVNIMQSHDWDEELMEHAVPLLCSLTFSPECVTMIAAEDGVQVLLNVMEQHSGNLELLLSGQVALTALVVSSDVREVISNIDGLDTMFGLLENNINNKPYVSELLNTLVRLSTDDTMSSSIAEKGMHILMDVTQEHFMDPEFLTAAFRVLGHLAFVESNLTIIVQHNGIQVIIKAISRHPDSKELMVRSIQTIDNIAMANKENATIVIDEGGRELIESIMEAYPEDEDIQRYGKSAILSMDALKNLSMSAAISKQSAKKKAEEVEAEKDPLSKFRNMLSAGSVLKVWTKGVPKACHVLASPDFRSIVWQDPKNRKKLGAMDLRSVVSVKPELGDGHKKRALSRKKCDPDCAFTVIGERGSLDLETNVKSDVEKWVNAFTELLHVFKTNPSKLV